MSAPARVYYGRKIEGVKIPAILLDGRDMHNASALWEAALMPPSKAPESFLQHIPAREYTESLARQSGVPAESLRHFNREGWWFTQLLAIEYARWISPDFGLMVNMLAVKAARDLARQADPQWRENRELGKESYRKVSGVRDEFDPLVRNGKDMKHPFANATVSREILGGTPTELREREGLGKNDNVWDKLASPVQLAMRHLAQTVEKERLVPALEYTRNPDVMLKIVERTAKEVKEANRRFLPGGES